jgi:glyceraldehyde-3-phosphate dehydrogenase (NAD(P))
MSTIHVVGTGTIGEPLIGLLCDIKHDLGIDEITFYKHSPVLNDRPKIKGLLKRGGVLAVRDEKVNDFRDLGIEPTYTAEEAIKRASVVIDCTPKGCGLENKEKYYRKYEDTVKAFLAQGSEFGFGKPFAVGINDAAMADDKYIQIVSCNTHNIAVAIQCVGLYGDGDNFASGRFVCIRRATDISQERKFIPAPEVNVHKDEKFGTHHAKDVWYLYNTLGYDLDVFSSALKTNTQYMHSIWFDINVKSSTSSEEIIQRCISNPRIAVTNKTHSNLVFSFGRDHGHYGRILNQTVISLPTISVRDNKEVFGYCFTPQDGNSILSSVSAVIGVLYPDEYREKIKILDEWLFEEV